MTNAVSQAQQSEKEALRLELPLLLVGDWVAAVAVVMLLVLRSYCAPDTTLWC